MKIRRLEIERFRGIRELEWDLEGSFVCLVGPGDSTKTTILDAIELVLSPRWSVQFDDCDFYNTDTVDPIVITATVGELPDELKSDAKYGLFVRGCCARLTSGGQRAVTGSLWRVSRWLWARAAQKRAKRAHASG